MHFGEVYVSIKYQLKYFQAKRKTQRDVSICEGWPDVKNRSMYPGL